MAVNNRRRSVRGAGLIAASVTLAAGVASAQYRIDNSQVNDASNQIGSGGFNGGVSNPFAARGFNNGNLLVTGNVTNGRAFRGSLGYTAPTQFRGNLGSGDFDRFIGNSVGVGQIREAASAVAANQATNTSAYFGPGQTVQRPAGFAQDPGYNGGFVPQGPRVIQSNDGRLDYGGATRAQVANGVLSQSTVIGGAGLASTSAASFLDRGRLDVSEYTSLAKPRTGLDNDLGNGGGLLQAARDAQLSKPDAVKPGAAPSAPGDASTQTPNAAEPSTAIKPIDATPSADNATTAQPSADAGKTGQNLSLRTQMNGTDGSQYGQLRERFDRQQRSKLPNADAAEQVRQNNEQILKARAAAAAKTDGSAVKTNDPKQPAGTPDANGPAPVQPNAVPQDQLRLPRPATPSDTAAPAAPAAAEGPIEIKTLTSGVGDAGLKKTLGDAEALMKAGKFTSAIDAYDCAEAMTTADPLVFVGRGIAELGGGYYRNAESHFRQAFAGDRSLLLARYDLNELLTKDRLNFMLDDLGRVANANKNDPGPLVLLAFVYYNSNLPDRAARALDLADQRAGGKDALATLFRANWTLKTATDGDNK